MASPQKQHLPCVQISQLGSNLINNGQQLLQAPGFRICEEFPMTKSSGASSALCAVPLRDSNLVIVASQSLL